MIFPSSLFLAALLLGQRSAAAPIGDPAAVTRALVWMVGPAQGGPTKRQPQPTEQLRARGHLLYERQCALCHGERGDGKGWLADQVRPTPTDFTRGVFKNRSTPTGTVPIDLDLFATITRGMHGTPMLPRPDMPEEDGWALVHHVMAFSTRVLQEAPESPMPVSIAPRKTKTVCSQTEALHVSLPR